MKSDSLWCASLGVACLFLMMTACGGGVTPIQTAFNKGAYQYSVGNYPMAVSEYREALAEDPLDQKARFNLALALEGWAGEAESAEQVAALRTEARAAYGAILVAMPDHPRALVNLAAMDFEDGQVVEAEDALRSAMARGSDNPHLPAALAAFLLRQGKLDDAHNVLRVALEADDTRGDLNALYGDVELQREAFPEADQAFARALERDAEDLHALVGRGEVAFRQGRLPDARSWMERALLIQPRIWRAHRVLAEAAEAEGKLEDAIWHWWQARDLSRTAAAPFAGEAKSLDYAGHLDRLYDQARQGLSAR